jgi:hypothetical protein
MRNHHDLSGGECLHTDIYLIFNAKITTQDLDATFEFFF